MNYLDYKRIMKERGLVENPITVEFIENAKVVHENMKAIKEFNQFDREVMGFHGVDIVELYKQLEHDKEKNIRWAIKYAWDEKKTIENMGKGYYSKLEILKKVAVPTETYMKKHYERECKIN